MSLSAREKRALHSVKGQLSGSDPELASLLAMFTRLAEGEDMPEREKVRTRWRRATRRSRRNRRQPLRDVARRLRRRVTWQGTGLALAVLLAFALLAAAVVLDGGGLGRGCPGRGAACAGQMPVRATSLARAFAVR